MNATKTDMTVGTEIARQIGHKAIVMMGIKNMVAGNDRLMFQVGRNANKVTNIVVKLNGLDLYDITYYNIRGINVKTLSESNNVYTEMLLADFEKNTGMRTSL